MAGGRTEDDDDLLLLLVLRVEVLAMDPGRAGLLSNPTTCRQAKVGQGHMMESIIGIMINPGRG